MVEELVSIIIPAYQEEKRIRRCLQNILASTYQNLELVVVNDGSTDHTAQVVRNAAKENRSSFRSIELINILHGGSGRARNCGLRKAKGRYIGFVDADDMIHPLMIEKLAQSLRDGSEMASCGLLFCDEDGKPGFHRRYIHGERRRCPGQALKKAMWEQIQMSLGTVLFRRENIIDERGELLISCPEKTAAFEDFAFVCRYLSRCNGIWDVLPFYGYFYCKHKGSLTCGRWSAQELSYALHPVLAAGESLEDSGFICHKLQYAFRFMAFWYVEACRSSKREFSPHCENWRICMRELERYADIYMEAPEVALHRKAAMWIVRNQPGVGRLLAKTAGRFIL